MNKNYKEVWANCLNFIRDIIPPVTYKTWFMPIQPLKLEGSILTIQVPSHFFYEYLEEQFIDLLRKSLRKELGKDAKLEYSIVVDNNGLTTQSQTIKLPTKDNTNLSNKAINVPLSDDVKLSPFIMPGIKKMQINPQLNPENSMGNFVEGECNRLARQAGMAVAKAPGQTPFNPLFIFGESGLGKTHLAQAIGIETKNLFPDKVVLYITANKFQTQYSDAVRSNNRNDFINFYQSIDVLVIDDVQEFAGKQGTQDTFFHIFNHLHQSGKQLILTSDRPPVELKGLSKRLTSRFKWGLPAELQVPDYATRMAILRHKIYKDGIVISEDVIKYIADNVVGNVRELEGALVSLLAQSTLNKKHITLELARETIFKLVRHTQKEISIEYIQKVVCEYFDLDLEVIRTKSRKREIVQARQIAMFFSKELTKSSLSTIGAEIGGRDHATVLHAFKTVKDLAQTDKTFKMYVEDIAKMLDLRKSA